MNELYRRSYAHHAEDILYARAPKIASNPIPELINFRNGLLDWRTGELRPHTPDVLSTVQLGAKWDPSATCPEFDKFLGEVLDADVIDLAWEIAGYLTFSGNPLHKAIMLTGKGRNGKGTFMPALVRLLGGEGNLASVTLHDLVNTRFVTASLFGKIANVAGDIDGSYIESTGIFKSITGQDLMSAEHKGRDRSSSPRGRSRCSRRTRSLRRLTRPPATCRDGSLCPSRVTSPIVRTAPWTTGYRPPPSWMGSL